MESGKLKEENENNSQLDKQTVLSQLPKGWEIKKLGEVCRIYQPKTISKKKMVTDGKYLVFGANGIIGKYNEYNHELPQLLVTCRGATCGAVNISLPKSWINGNAMVINPNKNNLLLKFVEYFFRGSVDLSSIITGAAQPQITRQNLSPVPIPIPPLPEQKRIVSILDRAFEAIDQAKANAEQNLKNTKELFQSKMQSIFENGKLKVDSGEWEEKKLNEISENLDNKRVPITKKDRKAGDIPYYGASGIVDYVADYIFNENLLCISEDGANLLARTYPIAFSISGMTWVNNHAHILKFKNMNTQKYVEFYLNSIKLDDFISGMAQPKLNQTKLNQIPIPLPSSIVEQQNIITKIENLSTETKKLEAIYQQKIDDLEELKKSILQKAFSGQLIMENE